jgi:hypothetical protein
MADAEPSAPAPGTAAKLAAECGQGSHYLEMKRAYGIEGAAEGDLDDGPGQSSAVQGLKEYRDSAAAKAKEDVVRGIARALKSKGFSSIDPDASDLKEIVRSVQAAVPDPRKGTSFSADAEKQKTACMAVAQALNEQFPAHGSKAQLIDTSAGPVSICRAVGDLVNSMSGEMCGELLEIKAGVRKALRELVALDKFAGDMHSEAVKSLQEGEDGAGDEASHAADPYLDAFRRLRAEIDKSMKELEGYLHIVLAPAEAELDVLAAEDSELYKRLTAQGLVPGDSAFGNTIAYALTSLGTLSAVAARTHEALDKVGISVDQYASSSSWDDLDNLIRGKEIPPEKAGQFERMIEKLRLTYWRKSEIAAAMRKKGGAERKTEMDKRTARRKAERKLILRQYMLRSQTAYSKILAAVKVLGPKLGREVPVTDQLNDLSEALDRLNNINIPKLDLSLIGFFTDAQSRMRRQTFLSQIGQLQRAAERLASSPDYSAHAGMLRPISEAVGDLVKTIDYYSSVVKSKYGGGKDDGSKPDAIDVAMKEEALEAEKEDPAVVSAEGREAPTAEAPAAEAPAAEAPAEDTFAKLTDELGAVESRVEDGPPDNVGSVDITDPGAGDDEEPAPAAAPPTEDGDAGDAGDGDGDAGDGDGDAGDGDAGDGDAVTGRGVSGGDEVDITELQATEQLRSTLDLGSAVNDFRYYIFVAKIRENLKLTASEFDKYGTKYDQVLGDAVAQRLQAIETERKELLDETKARDDAHMGAKIISETDAAVVAAGNADVQKAAREEWEAARAAIEEEYKTKKDFYRLLQAVDMHMKAFAKGIASDPDAVIDIKKALHGVENVAKWFTDQTGEELHQFFDQTQMMGNVDRPAHHPDMPAGAQNDHYYDRVAYSLAAVAGDQGPGTGGSVSANRAKDLRNTAGRALNNFQALKNLLNAFARLGSRLGGVDLQRQTFMTSAEMYKIMIKFLKVSSISSRARWGAAANANADLGFGPVPQATAAGNVQMPNAAAGGVGAQVADNAQTNGQRRVYVTPAGAGAGPLPSNWDIENQFFQFIVKCIASKVLVVLGVFDLFERPEPLYELTPTRMILGGGPDGPVEVIPEAAELYFRLPRLAEFYFTLFNFGTETIKISMLPEMEGVFSSLISQVFIKSASVAESGEYSNQEAEDLVSIVNAIYDKYRDRGDKACSAVVNDFVAEINRRYGLVKKEEWDKLKRIQDETRRGFQDTNADHTNYAILPDEDLSLYDDARRMAPSDRYMRPQDRAVSDMDWTPGKYHLDDNPLAGAEGSSWKMLSDFRNSLSQKLAGANRRDIGRASYRTMIVQTRREIRQESDPQKKADLALRLIQGSEMVTGGNQSQLLMFHETVVVALNSLTALHDQLGAFRSRMNDCDAVRLNERLIAWMNSEAANSPNAGADRAHFLLWLGVPANNPHGIDVGRATHFLHDAAPAELVTLYPPPLVPDASNRTTAQLWAAAGDAAVSLDVDVRAAANAAAVAAARALDRSAAQRRVARLLLDRQRIMSVLVRTVFELTADFDEMVAVRFPGGATSKLHLNFNKLRDHAAGLLDDVRKYMDLFRSVVGSATISHFEGGIGDQAPRGTLNWLERHLVDGMLKPTRTQAGAVLADAAAGNTLEGLATRVNSSMVELTRTHADFLDIQAGAIAVAPRPLLPAEAAAQHDQYGMALCRLVFWDARQVANGGVNDESGVNGAAGLLTARTLGQFVRAKRGPGLPAADPNPDLMSQGNAIINNGIGLYAGGVTNDRSMLFMFNQLVAMYLDRNFDDPSNKVYQGLLDAFSNGPLSQAVMVPGYSQPDISNGGVEFGRRGDPTGRAVLLTSLATVVQRWITDKTAQGTSRYLTATLSEVPLYKKEAYRAHLPVFNKMFQLMTKQGELIKQMIQRCKIQCARPDMTALAGVVAGNVAHVGGGGAVAVGVTPGEWPAGSNVGGVTLHPVVVANPHETVRNHIVDVIDGITSCTYAMTRTGEAVLREIADEPLYLQTSEGSIQDYKARNNGKLPLMPLSLSLYYLRSLPNGADNGSAAFTHDQELLPLHGAGTQEARMMYGTRGLLAPKQKVGLGSMPGVKNLVESYNAAFSGQTLDALAFEGFVGRVSRVLRYLVDTRSYRTTLIDGRHTFGAAHTFAPAAIAPGVISRHVWPMQNGRTQTQVLEIVDSTFQEEKIGDLVAGLSSVNASDPIGRGAREQERLKNLIDLNISPIVPHALMRTMALANTYNYAYTFEEMACRFFGESRATVATYDPSVEPDHPAAPGGGGAAPPTARAFFLRLLINPYSPVHINQYGREEAQLGTAAHFQRVCRGDDGLVLGRPKFISDQLFNKVLFGSIYPAAIDYDESGPSGGIGRGRDDWGLSGRAHLDLGGRLLELVNPLINQYHTMLQQMGMGAAGRILGPRGLYSPISRESLGFTLHQLAKRWHLAGSELERQRNQWVRRNMVPAAAEAQTARDGAGAISSHLAHASTGPDPRGYDYLLTKVDGMFRHMVLSDPANENGSAGAGAWVAAARARFLALTAQPNYGPGLNAILVDRQQNGRYDAAFLGAGADVNEIDWRVFIIALDPLAGAPADAPLLAIGNPVALAGAAVSVAHHYSVVFQALHTTAIADFQTYYNHLRDQRRLQARAGTSASESRTGLTYILEDTPGQHDPPGARHARTEAESVRQVQLLRGQKQALTVLGHRRFDTALVRNLFFITNVYRLTRAKLNHELAQQRTIIQRGSSLVSATMTEYDSDARTGPGERAGQRQFYSERSMLHG